MDSTRYKDLTTSRSLKYHYYFSAPEGGKPIVVLLHGFPSSSFDWHNQVTHLQKLGYGLIVPDMLGYGGTAKPADPSFYKFKDLTQDVIDILDAEGVKTAVVKQIFNKEILGYQAFFAAPDGAALCEKNFDSFYSLVHAKNTEELWPKYVCPSGTTREWIEANMQAVLDPYIPAEDHAYRKATLQKQVLEAPMCWYKVRFADLELEETTQIPQSAYSIEKPVFLGVAEKDTVTSASLAKGSTGQ
ncbi:hypothetical protein NP233_g7615 [Leucocoprinus birnbaumii]|uniref:AB hydrolase-1 domain-containing protein n=1 Tax=Leucocoprinus birnbaumii TaxID=56174 RepID=A0AAD5YUF8_9AGAR|nr:hypothetical protein NP233_g7615 [Leucocoprinus birnbaumii]